MGAVDDDTRAWHHHLEQMAIPLCLLDRDGNPQKPGTGTLIEFCDRTILLTAAHVDEGLHDTSWAILLRYDEALAEAQFYTLGPLQFFYRARLGQDGRGEFIDVAYALVPSDIRPRHQAIKNRGHVFHEDDRLISVTDLRNDPVKGARYGFAGYTKPFTALSEGFFGGDTMIEDRLTYVERRGDRHVFGLSAEHPGHDEYEGCSGTAICGEADGGIVSILLGGDVATREIYGLAFDTIRNALLVACGRESESGSHLGDEPAV